MCCWCGGDLSGDSLPRSRATGRVDRISALAGLLRHRGSHTGAVDREGAGRESALATLGQERLDCLAMLRAAPALLHHRVLALLYEAEIALHGIVGQQRLDHP